MSEEIAKQWLAKAHNDMLNADDWFMPTEQDALEARQATNKVLKWLKKALPNIM